MFKSGISSIASTSPPVIDLSPGLSSGGMPSSVFATAGGINVYVDSFPEPARSTDSRFLLYKPRRVLGLAAVVAITYFFGCGGPLGTEPLVAQVGPLLAVIALLSYWFVVTLPFAATVAELSSAFPDDGGFAVWVLNAFGPFWGFQIGYWSVTSGILNSAMYPGLLLSILKDLGGVGDLDEGVEYALQLSIGLVLAAPAFASSQFVGRGAIALLIVVWIPLLMYIVTGLGHSTHWEVLGDINPRNDSEESTPLDWESLLNTLFWNFDGIHMASAFAGQVANPARVYTRAIPAVAVLVVLTYVLPIVATAATNALDWRLFDRGAYVITAQALGGDVLRVFMVISTVATTAGLYISNLYCKSLETAGMAEYCLLPRVFGKRNDWCGSPHLGVLVTLVPTLALTGFNFDVLLPVTNAFASLVALLILASNIQLRVALPFIARPAKVPGGFVGVFAISIVPAAVFIYIIASAFATGGWRSAFLIVGFLLPGLVYGAYQSRQRAARAGGATAS